MSRIAHEVNFDGIVGPTHNYSGLSFGNIASSKNHGAVANPKLAALQGLAKMKALHDRGLGQGVLAPQERPNVAALRALGFSGSDADVLTKAARSVGPVFNSIMSASSMWAANAATVSPSANTSDGHVHFTAANLNNKFHRSMEHPTTSRILRAMFPGDDCFAHHEALPANPQFGGEGAANHTRLCARVGAPGVELFVFGANGFDTNAPAPKKFPARQTREASEAVARLHGLGEARTVFAQQHPDVIDAGVFHNDVIAVGHRDVLFYHEAAFLYETKTIAELTTKLDGHFKPIRVGTADVGVTDAVETYLFNSQLLSKPNDPNGQLSIVVPDECQQNPRVWAYLENMARTSGIIDEVLVFDLRESMRNGGGPACLRLRVELNEEEAEAVNPKVLLNDARYAALTAWVGKHYRDRMGESDLGDPALLIEVRTALDELTQLLGLGSVYPFQLN